MLAPALLSVISQFTAVAYFSRHNSIGEVIAFQAMLSLWSWTLVLGFGMDRRARGFAQSLDGLGAYAVLWRLRLIWGSVLGALCGALLGVRGVAGPWVWGAYGAALVACAMGFSGREWMYAQGEVKRVNQGLSFAFVMAIVSQGVLAWMGAPFGLIALCWFVPHVILWMKASTRLGLFRGGTLSGNLRRESSQVPYGLQALGHVALCSLDVVLANLLMVSESEVFRFVIYSRLAFAAFMVSANFAAAFVSESIHCSGKAWRKVFLKCAAVHCAWAILGVMFLAAVGPMLTHLWLGQELVIHGGELVGLAWAGVSRSVSEAAMQTMSGPHRTTGALSSFVGSALGLTVFGLLITWGAVGAFTALAIAWSLPSLIVLGWVALRGR